MDWWVLELIVTSVLVLILFVLGPVIKRFGKSYAADIFRSNPRTGKSYLVLMDVAYYLIFTAFYHSGIPELVQEGVSGFLVPERDVDFLAKKLAYLLNHQEIWPRLGRAGREHIEKHYDIHKLNDQLVDIYMTQLDRT